MNVSLEKRCKERVWSVRLFPAYKKIDKERVYVDTCE
jgi:hypothetical protein